MILAIDPGNIESAYVVLDQETLKPQWFAKVDNEELLEAICFGEFNHVTHIAIEMIAHYGAGMPAGKSVFDTCVWIGRFWQAIISSQCIGINPDDLKFIYRKEVKMNLCQSMKAKDSNIIQALKDRFGDKGTKKSPGWFYGFSKDVWQAYAVGVTYADLYLKVD